MALLDIYAGAKAKRYIESNGLAPNDIATIFGASGAAKWLAIYGLDRAIFEQWLPSYFSTQSSASKDVDHGSTNRVIGGSESSATPIKVFGTSVGAWKLAAACQNDPGVSLERLANAYIDQSYAKKAKPEDVVYQTERILETLLPESNFRQLLDHPYLRYSCGAVRCRGFLANNNPMHLAAGMAEGFLRSLGSKGYGQMFERAVFSVPTDMPKLMAEPGVVTTQYALAENNLRDALRASAAIPYIMDPISDIDGVDQGQYRDGGLLDYHPIANRFWGEEGLVLYPHFYSYLVPNWFDKFYAKRRATTVDLDKVIMLSPSQSFLASLPDGRLPDRKDFSVYKGRNEIRQKRWRHAMNASLELGQEFLSWTQSGDLAASIKDFKGT